MKNSLLQPSHPILFQVDFIEEIKIWIWWLEGGKQHGGKICVHYFF